MANSPFPTNCALPVVSTCELQVGLTHGPILYGSYCGPISSAAGWGSAETSAAVTSALYALPK